MSEEARLLVQRAIDAVDRVDRPSDFPGLDSVTRDLAKMRDALAEGEIDSTFGECGLGRLVTDSWPLGSEVSEAVIAAERAVARAVRTRSRPSSESVLKQR